MKYPVSAGSFDSKRHTRSIHKILDARSGVEKERYFKNIARDILRKEGFDYVMTGPPISQFQGVPFDFIALKNSILSLIELKGSISSFNYSSEVQFARFYHVVTELKKRGIAVSTYMLQINLTYSLYQILDSQFYDMIFGRVDKTVGLKRPIVPIVHDIIERMKRKGIAS